MSIWEPSIRPALKVLYEESQVFVKVSPTSLMLYHAFKPFNSKHVFPLIVSISYHTSMSGVWNFF